MVGGVEARFRARGSPVLRPNLPCMHRLAASWGILLAGLACALTCPAARGMELRVIGVLGRSALLGVDEQTAASVRSVNAWEVVGPEERAQLVRYVPGVGVSGRCAVLAAPGLKPVDRIELVQILANPLEPGTAYDVALQCRGNVGPLGEATLYVEARRSPDAPWQEQLRLPLDPASVWLTAGGRFRLKEAMPDVRVGIRLRGRGTLMVDEVLLVPVGGGTVSLIADGGFEGRSYWQLDYREVGADEWVSDPAVIHEASHTVLGLRPLTRYEARARRVSVAGAVLEESLPIAFQTSDETRRRVIDLVADEPRPIQSAALSSPCLVGLGSRVFLVAAHGGGIYVHTVESDATLGEPAQIVSAVQLDSGIAEIGSLQACALDGAIFVVYRLSQGPDLDDQTLRLARFDLATGATVGPRSVNPRSPGRVAWNGGVAAWHGTVHVVFAETIADGPTVRTGLTLRAHDPLTLEPIGEDVAVPRLPSTSVFGPSLATLGDLLVVMYSDMAHVSGSGSARSADVEPLYAQLWDGRLFGDPFVVSAEGRNRFARGVQVGARLAIVWKYGGPYPEGVFGDYMFHDVGFGWLYEDGTFVGPESCVHDQTYNASPSIALLGDRLLVVSRKWEHHYGLTDDPAEELGLWATWLAPEWAVRQ